MFGSIISPSMHFNLSSIHQQLEALSACSTSEKRSHLDLKVLEGWRQRSFDLLPPTADTDLLNSFGNCGSHVLIHSCCLCQPLQSWWLQQAPGCTVAKEVQHIYRPQRHGSVATNLVYEASSLCTHRERYMQGSLS